jgi:hypothetical protein
MSVARLRLAPAGETAKRAKRADGQSPLGGAPSAPHEPPSPTARAPKQAIWAAPAMSVAAAKASGRNGQGTF